ncbi:MAG TPA: aminoglycoside phosphotransferase family protein [Actinophytocola sp.]|uniref:aminoglycoside phosphotransferase family protein n=1 Tax=Actinophytocola sp. TaxID=1872138 RepID=UPI002DDD4931|nr:aminoglycoside phosphotransferase family protein [Actinophytocola sp.]HEV2778230.1 aminoglycoside phosphotransferase family protein [Actinophytocola sp.]
MTVRYHADVQRCLAPRFGGPVELEPPHVQWDRRAVCRATLPGGRRAVIKIDQDPARHAREVAGLRAAWEAGAPVPRVLWSGRGEYWVLVLAEVPTRRSLADGGRLWRAAGAATRRLHSARIPARLPMFCDGGQDWAEHMAHRVEVEAGHAVERGLLNRAEANATIQHAVRALAAAGPVNMVLLHGDLQARHVLVHGNAVVLVDFGDAGWGDPALDLVVLTHLDPHRRAEVLDGYGADRSLRDRIGILGPTYSLWRNMFVSRWYFENSFEQRRNTAVARRVLETQVLAGRESGGRP